MRIVVDNTMDMANETKEKYNIITVPLSVTLDGKIYVGEKDITNEAFYDILKKSDGFPTTGTPSPGMFTEVYREIAKEDPDILSIHISTGLSGTMDAAKIGAKLVPEANITFIDSKTLSGPFAWQVEMAAKAIEKGYSIERIIKLLKKVNLECHGMYTIDELKYLIHGGRISHLKGLLASLLKIKPVIGVGKEDGKYFTVTQQRTMKKAIRAMADVVVDMFGDTPVRVQLLHAGNIAQIKELEELLKEKVNVTFLPTLAVATALGAHTGPSVVGFGFGPLALFESDLLD